MEARGSDAPGASAADRSADGDEPLLERDVELAALRSALDRDRRAGDTVVVRGAPGLGKTRLLSVVQSRVAATGRQMFVGRGRELEQQVSLGVAVDLLAPAVLAAEPGERARMFGGLAAPAAPLFAASLSVDVAGRWSGEAMALGLCWLVANLTGWAGKAIRRTLLTVDDLQWVDTASLRFLTMLADRVDRLPLVLVVAVRDGAEGDAAATVHRLASGPRVRMLRLAPLSAGAVGGWVTQFVPAADQATVAAVHHASGGNPFLVAELVRSLRAEDGPTASAIADLVPETVVGSVLTRLARMPAEAGGLARSAAVLGDGTPLRRVARHAGLELSAAETAADALVAAHVLRVGDPVTFLHPLVCAAVYADQPGFARAGAHRRAADLLIADGAATEQVAGHLLKATPSNDAATSALERGDAGAAVRLLERALSEPPPPCRRGPFLVELARAQASKADPAALTTVSEALDSLRDAPGRSRAQALTVLAEIRQARGDLAGSAAAHGMALELLAPGDEMHDDLLAGYVATAMFVPALAPDANRRILSVLQDAERGTPPRRPTLLANVTLQLALDGAPPATVRQMAARALADDALLAPEAPVALLGLVLHGLVIAGEATAADKAASAALATARRRGDLVRQSSASYHRALARFGLGALTAALADLEAARTAYHAAGLAVTEAWIDALLALVHLERGDRAAALAVLAQAFRANPGDDGTASMDMLLVRHVHARVALAGDDAATALAEAAGAGRLLADGYGIDHPGLMPWRNTAALAAHHLGDHRQARHLADQAIDVARRMGVPAAVGNAFRIAGLVTGPPAGLDLLIEAVSVLGETSAALDYATSLIDLGAARRRAGQRKAAQQPLREGLALADHLRARPLADRAYAELGALGRRPRRTAVAGVDALTPAERRVALLALHGQSNPQIAQGLFVTIKTVETHLARAYRKLGITGRRQLRDIFAS